MSCSHENALAVLLCRAHYSSRHAFVPATVREYDLQSRGPGGQVVSESNPAISSVGVTGACVCVCGVPVCVACGVRVIADLVLSSADNRTLYFVRALETAEVTINATEELQIIWSVCCWVFAHVLCCLLNGTAAGIPQGVRQRGQSGSSCWHRSWAGQGLQASAHSHNLVHTVAKLVSCRASRLCCRKARATRLASSQGWARTKKRLTAMAAPPLWPPALAATCSVSLASKAATAPALPAPTLAWTE